MKGIIFIAFKETIIKNFGKYQWEIIFEQSSMPKDFPILKSEIYDDKFFYELLKISQKELQTDLKTLFDAFAEYFLFTYIPKNLYYVVENVKSSKDLFENLDLIHRTLIISASLKDIPRFDYKEIDTKTAELTYKSARKLYELFYSMVTAVAKKYQDCQIERISDNKIRIRYK